MKTPKKVVACLTSVLLTVALALPLTVTPALAADQPQMLFVMVDGSVVHARLLRKLATGYMIRGPKGDRVLAYDQVKEVVPEDPADVVAEPPPALPVPRRAPARAAPQTFDEEDERPEVPGRGMQTTGWILFGVGTSVALLAASAYDNSYACYSYDSYSGDTSCFYDKTYSDIATIGLATAATGLTLAIIGHIRRGVGTSRLHSWERRHALPESDAKVWPVVDEAAVVATPVHAPAPAPAEWAVAPFATPAGGLGMAMAGRF